MSNLNQAINSWIESLHCYIKGFPAEIVPLMNLENDMKKFLESKPEPTEFTKDPTVGCTCYVCTAWRKDRNALLAVIDSLTAELAEARKKPEAGEFTKEKTWDDIEKEVAKTRKEPDNSDKHWRLVAQQIILPNESHVAFAEGRDGQVIVGLHNKNIDRLTAELKAKDKAFEELQIAQSLGDEG